LRPVQSARSTSGNTEVFYALTEKILEQATVLENAVSEKWFWFCAAGAKPNVGEKILEQAMVSGSRFSLPIAKTPNRSDFGG